MADNVLEPYTFSFGDAKSASIGCSSRVWDFPTSIFAMQNKQMYIQHLQKIPRCNIHKLLSLCIFNV